MEALIFQVQTFVLVMVRISAWLLLVPILGGRPTPSVVKVAVALSLSLFMCRTTPAGAHALTTDGFLLLIIKEAMVGLLLGFTLLLVLASIQAVGELIGFQMMFSAASVFSALTMEQTTVIGDFFYMLAMLIFLILDGPRTLISGLDLSFRTLPVTAWPGSLGSISVWMTLCGRVFEISLKLAMPLLAALFITNLALGMIARTLPQINVFVIGMPVQIAAGFIVLFIMLGSLFHAEGSLFKQWALEWRGWIQILAP